MTSNPIHLLDSGSFLALLASERLAQIAASLDLRFAVTKRVASATTHLYSVVDGQRGSREAVDFNAELRCGALEILATPTADELVMAFQLQSHRGLGANAALLIATAFLRNCTLVTDDARAVAVIHAEHLTIRLCTCLNLICDYSERTSNALENTALISNRLMLRGAFIATVLCTVPRVPVMAIASENH